MVNEYGVSFLLRNCDEISNSGTSKYDSNRHYFRGHAKSMSLALGGGGLSKKMTKCDKGGGGLSERVMSHPSKNFVSNFCKTRLY